MVLLTIFISLALYVISSPVDSISFTRYPSDQSVEEGGTATFHCAVSDKGNTYVYWQKNKSVYLSRDRNVTMYAPIHPELTQRLSIVGLANPGKFSLRISNVKSSDEGIYQCVFFQDMFSYYSPEARLVVLPKSKPTLSCSSARYRTPNESDVTDVDIGTNVQLICEEFFFANAERNLSTLYWYKSGEPNDLFSPHYCITTSLSQRCVYIKTILSTDLDVSYGCRKNAPIANSENFCQVTPFSSNINVTVSPLASSTKIGDSVTFVCSTTEPTTNLQFEWFLNENPIQYERDNSVHKWNFDRITLENINVADNGTVMTCILRGDNGSLGTGSAVLLVQGYSTVTTTTTADSTSLTTSKFLSANITSTGTKSRETMSTITTKRYAIFSPRNTSRDGFNSNSTEQALSTEETVTNIMSPTSGGIIVSWDGFGMVVAIAAAAFAFMCLLALANVAVYIVHKKHRVYRQRQKQRRYALDKIRPGLDDSVMLEKLSPKTRRKPKYSASSYYSDTDGKQIPSPQPTRKVRQTAEDIATLDSDDLLIEIHFDSDSGSSSKKSSSSSTKYQRKAPSAPAMPQNAQYRVIDPLRSESLIESVKQREAEMETSSKKMKARTLSSSSSESQLSPRYKSHLESRRKCSSLNHGVIPPWHKQGKYDDKHTPAYAVVNLFGSQMRPSKSFSHNRPPPSKPGMSKRISSKSLHDRPKQIRNSLNIERQIEPRYDNRRQPNRSRPMSDGFQYDNFKSAAVAGVTLIPDLRPTFQVDPYVISHENTDSSSSEYSLDNKDLEWDVSPCAHSLSYSDPELDHTQSFFADQPLPLTPLSPVDEEIGFAYPAERRLSGESRRRSFVQRQRSYSDSYTGPHCALDVIKESFGSGPLSSASSGSNLNLPERGPLRVESNPKVLYRQHKIADDAVRPTSEPIKSDYAKVTKPRNAASDDDESLVTFPPYRIQSVSGGTDLTSHWMSANPSPNTKRKSVRLVRDT